MIEYIKGDLIKSDCDVIIHGCNCFHTMGSGIAKQIRETYPEAYEADKLTVYGDKEKLGHFSHVNIKNKYFDKNVYIINAYTQYKYGREPGIVYADYKAIDLVMYKINMVFENKPELKIGMPKIGAGLAQGDWNIIKHIINDIFISRKVYVYEFNTANEINEKKYKDSYNNYKNILNKEYKDET